MLCVCAQAVLMYVQVCDKAVEKTGQEESNKENIKDIKSIHEKGFHRSSLSRLLYPAGGFLSKMLAAHCSSGGAALGL